MKPTIFTFLATSIIYPILVATTPITSDSSLSLKPRQDNCENTATSRSCWGEYNINTDYYTVTPNTGVTREYWLSVDNTTLAPDGYERQVLAFNGTVPGPTITADWGDEIVIHVTNNLEYNGTAIHWHGLRQLNTNEYDGVPGVTQCPIAPGETMTYRFQATQYGSTWYHSHLSLQYGDGLLGPMIINGPATSDYDEDLGVIFLSDWAHTSVFKLWAAASTTFPPSLENGLINGMNTYDCSDTDDEKCIGGGKKFELVFESGKKYRLRLVNSAVEGHFQFSLDGHKLQVIANDLVPIVPFDTDSLLVSIGQRYDVIIEANQDPGDYWLRSGWQSGCQTNQNADNITAIVRYDNSSTADPTTTSNITISSNCGDEPLASLVPWLALDVGNYSQITEANLGITFGAYTTWTINSSSLLLDWAEPTNLKLANNVSIWPTEYNVIPIDKTETSEWALFVINDETGVGLTHPVHLHGHDFWVVGQTTDNFQVSDLNLINPPRRDVASLPGGGYLAIAFKIDNPGSWLMHCHIAWHASEGFALQFVETESDITSILTDTQLFQDTCSTWDVYEKTQLYLQEDSGI